MSGIWRDILHGIRILAKRPSVTAIAVLTTALGVGANTAIFSVVNAVLLRPLPYQEPGRLVFLGETSPQIPDMSISMANFDDWVRMNNVFESMAPYRTNSFILTGQGDAEVLRVREITAGLFPTLGFEPIIGRALSPDDDKPGSAPVVLLSDGFWTRKFARDPNVIGKKLVLGSELYTVIGVIPSSRFHGSWRQMSAFTSMWRHEDTEGGPTRRDAHPGIYAIARMKPGVSLDQAKTEMAGIAARLDKQYPDMNGDHGISVQPLLDALVGDVRPYLLLLLAAVGFVLLIACGNVANLMLARAAERNKEMAIRAALGAGRYRLIRQLLAESVVLAMLGGTLGLLIASWVTSALAGVASSSVPRIETVSVDRWVLLFTFGISVLTGMIFGIFPARQVSRIDVNDALKESGRSGTSGTGHERLRGALIVAEVAVSMALLVGAGLMLKSLYRVLKADPGFDATGVMTAQISLPDARYPKPEQQNAFVQQLMQKVGAAPGVQSVGLQNPLLGGRQFDYVIEGVPTPPVSQMPATDLTFTTPDALKTMGVRLIAGRYFNESDNDKSAPVCLVDVTLARIAWPHANPLGKRMSVADGPDPESRAPYWRTVVGVVAHVKNYGVDQPSREETYVPFLQHTVGGGTLVVHTSADAASVASALRMAVKSMDSNMPPPAVRSLEDIVAENVAPRRLSVLLLSSFAALAMLLAALGLYGVMSYLVAQRSREIGIRIALGAQAGDILGLVLRNGMAMLAAGVAAGLALAFGMSHFMQALLFQVKATDVVTYVSVPLVLVVVALLACYLPARRAMRVDPVVALRSE
jgi:putative ABC transport system permease protein